MASDGRSPSPPRPRSLAEGVVSEGGLVYGVHKKPPNTRGFTDRDELLKRVDMEERQSGAREARGTGPKPHRTVDSLNKKLGMLPLGGGPIPSTPPGMTGQEQAHFDHQRSIDRRAPVPQADLPYGAAVKRNNKAALTQGAPIHFNLDGLGPDAINTRDGEHPDAYTSSEARFVRRNMDSLPHVHFYDHGHAITRDAARDKLGPPTPRSSSRPGSAGEDAFLLGTPPAPPRSSLPSLVHPPSGPPEAPKPKTEAHAFTPLVLPEVGPPRGRAGDRQHHVPPMAFPPDGPPPSGAKPHHVPPRALPEGEPPGARAHLVAPMALPPGSLPGADRLHLAPPRPFDGGLSAKGRSGKPRPPEPPGVFGGDGGKPKARPHHVAPLGAPGQYPMTNALIGRRGTVPDRAPLIQQGTGAKKAP